MNNFYLTTELVNQHVKDLTDQATRYRIARGGLTSIRWFRRRRQPRDDSATDGRSSGRPGLYAVAEQATAPATPGTDLPTVA